MKTNNFIEQLGLDRAISVFTDAKVSESQNTVLTELKEKEFGIDAVYFCTDENRVSYPAVFIKKVTHFDTTTFAEIAKVQQKVWNYKKVLFLYVYSETDIKIYNCAEKPLLRIEEEKFDFENEIKKIELASYNKSSDKEKLQELNTLFSSIAIDTGIIWTIEEAALIRKKINLQRRVDKYLVESLINTANQLKDQGLSINFIHKIIMRSLFLLYLEDRKATDKVFYSEIRKGAISYFDILDNVEDTNLLFEKLDKHFNGNVFTLENEEDITVEQLQLIKKCFISGNDNTSQLNLYPNWKLFDFSIIQIELLSEIYENFLSEIDKESKKQTGSFYTSPALVELILNEKLPIHNKEEKYNVKVLDPSCGSGIFLVESFKRLVKRHENHHNKKLTDFETLKKLLTDNVFGIEINPQSIKVAAFSLYLALVDNLDPKTIWQKKKHQLPYLINDSESKSIKKQGNNLYCRDTILENEEIEKIEFDLVIGNPPFGTKNLLPSIRNYNTEHNFAKEAVLPFLHKSIKFAPNGKIALIFNTKVLTNTGGTYQNFRKWLFNECYVEKVYNFSILRKASKNAGGQLFGSATSPISIVFYKKQVPQNPSDRIIYYAPKTFIKSNIIEGVNIDSTDIKYLPREECQKPTTKIWKIAMWGGINDFNFIDKLNRNKNLYYFLEEQKIKKGVGLQFLDNSTNEPIPNDEIPNTYVLPKNIKRYKIEKFSELSEGLSKASKIIYSKYYNQDINNLSKINVFRRTGKEKVYKSPHLLIKEGLSDWKICASFTERECSFNSKVIGFWHTDPNILKGLVCFLNSDFVHYYVFLCSASIGIEREEVKPNEIYKIPFRLSTEDLYELADIYDDFIKSDDIFYSELITFETKINEYICKIYEISKNELFMVNDFIAYNVPLITKKYEKIFFPVLESILLKDYCTIFLKTIHEFLEGNELFANATIYTINRFSPLMMIKISFEDTKKEVFQSEEQLTSELKELDKYLWQKNSPSIYFRKKLNYKTGNDVYIIRPNQRRFWTKSMALEDASELILEILNNN